MNRLILRIALPGVVSNITVPLLALTDTTIAGHLGSAAYIGAVAVGGMVFNMAYWLFGFLRMGTGGMTARAFGADDAHEQRCILFRSLSVALAVAAALMLLQQPILNFALRFAEATPEVSRLTTTYFRILIWGAPAVLCLYSYTGWFLGMQNARVPMWTALVQNVINIAVSCTLVLAFGQGIAGIATGTLVAQYAGLIIAVMVWRRHYSRPGVKCRASEVFDAAALRGFFRVNSDIFLRTLCLISVTSSFTAFGSARGELTLAANTLLMQLFVLFSYVMDGFAYAGEALGGRYCGAGDRTAFRRLTRALFVWGIALSAVYTLVYALGGTGLLRLLTDEAAVVSTARAYLPFACLIPLVSFSAFLFDGLFIGGGGTRQMLCSMALASLAYFALTAWLPPTNSVLWSAFLTYLGGRGLIQALLYARILRNIHPVKY